MCCDCTDRSSHSIAELLNGIGSSGATRLRFWQRSRGPFQASFPRGSAKVGETKEGRDGRSCSGTLSLFIGTANLSS